MKKNVAEFQSRFIFVEQSKMLFRGRVLKLALHLIMRVGIGYLIKSVLKIRVPRFANSHVAIYRISVITL
jgi:hypothetical protein